MKKVFVSHATADADLVSEFVDTVLLATGLDEDDIFVSSMAGMGVPAGADLLGHIRTTVDETTLVIAIVSKTYPTRPVCVAELGAAWGVSGKLHPILVPGVDRGCLDGVLDGVKVDYLDEEDALDELAQRIEEATGARPAKQTTWSRGRRKWLQKVGDLVANLPEPRVATVEELDAERAHSSELAADLADAEGENDALRSQVAKLREAKDRMDVVEALLPENEIERFEALRREAQEALESAPVAVREAIRCRMANETFSWPDRYNDSSLADAVDEAVTDGFLVDQEEYLELNPEYGVVERTLDAVERLAAMMEDGGAEDFAEWFRGRYDGPPELGRKAIWTAVFPRL